MPTYVRVRTVKPGQFQGAINFLKEYRGFLESELQTDVRVGTEVGRMGTIVTAIDFDNAQAMEDALKKLRGNQNYVRMIDDSARFFADQVDEHLIMEIPL